MNTTYPGLYPCKVPTIEEMALQKPKYPDGWSPIVYQPESGLGLLYCSPLDSKIRENFTIGGIEMQFVDYWPTKQKDGSPFHCIRACYTKVIGSGFSKFYLVHIHLTQLDINVLKNMQVWQVISEEVKKQLENKTLPPPKGMFIKEIRNIIQEKTPETKKRKTDHTLDNLPRELLCSTPYCTEKMTYISPTMLIEKANAKGITPEEYAANWKCAKCAPRKKGKVASGKWNGFTDQLVCSCGFTTKQHPSMIDKQAKATGKSYEDYVTDYRCRKCKPETEMKHRGRKSDPNSPWFGKTKELKCKCGTIVIQQPSLTYKLAEKLGVSYDDYVLAYQCKECRPAGKKRGRPPKIAKAVTTTTTTTPAIVESELPNKTICKGCNKVVGIVASNIREKAAILGITPEYLVLNYKCRSCGGKLKKGQKQGVEAIS